MCRCSIYLTHKQTIATWKKLLKENYGFTAEEYNNVEDQQDVELSDGYVDAEDYEAEYRLSCYISTKKAKSLPELIIS